METGNLAYSVDIMHRKTVIQIEKGWKSKEKEKFY